MADGKTRQLSIYLLKDKFDESKTFVENNALRENTKAKNIPRHSRLFLAYAEFRPPVWAKYLGIDGLKTLSQSAILIIKTEEKDFAICFGSAARHKLRDDAYEYDFGCLVTLNCIDPKKIKNYDSLALETASRRRTQTPIAQELSFFDLDNSSELMKTLAGHTKEEFAELSRSITGSQAVMVGTKIDAQDLPNFCLKLLERYKSKDYQDIFDDYDKLKPVGDKDLIKRLNDKLVKAISDRSEDIHLSLPGIIDPEEISTFKYRGFNRKSGTTFSELFRGDYFDLVQSATGKPLEIDEIKKHRVSVFDISEAERRKESIYKCILFDTRLDGKIYHLNEGKWWQIDQDFAKKLKAYLNNFFSSPILPDYNHENEAEYNTDAAKKLGGQCLDRKNIAPNGETQIEPCDILLDKASPITLIHVKRSTLSNKLSHLFEQGKVSLEVLGSLQECREKLKGLTSINIDGDTQFKIVFGIVTKKDAAGGADNFPIFSQMALRRTLQYLSKHDKTKSVCFCFIRDASSPSS